MYKFKMLLFVALVGNIFGYSSNGHRLISELSIDYLSSKGKDVPYEMFYGGIIASSAEPDQIPLHESEINRIFPGLNYDFNHTIARSLSTAWTKFVFTKTTGANIVTYGTGLVISELVSRKIFDEADPSDIEDLKTSTQHTFVGYYSSDDPIARLPEFSQTIGKISIADYCAEVEYQMAVMAWKSGNRPEAIRRLGRSLHYVQDITTPHHSNLTMNLPDITRFALAKIDEKYMNKLLNPAEPDNMEYSQAKYDDIGYTKAVSISNSRPFASTVFQKWDQSNSNFRDESIRQLMKNTRDDIIGTNLIGYADGYGPNGYSRGFFKNLWQKVKDFFKEEVIDPIKDTVAGILANFLQRRMSDSYHFRNVPENPEIVADELVPLAIIRSAQIIEKFYYETENWNSEAVDMTPVNMLLLD